MLCKIISADEIPDEIEIKTFEEFEKTLAQFTTYPPSNESTISVELPSGLLIFNLSCPKTSLSYTPYDDFKQILEIDSLVSVGNLSDESGQVINFYWDYFGECWIRELKRHLISQKQVRMAVRYFIQTGGQLTDEIIWEKQIFWNKYLEIYEIFDNLMSQKISTHHNDENDKFQQNEKAKILMGLLETKLGDLETKAQTHIKKLDIKTLNNFIWLVKRLDEV